MGSLNAERQRIANQDRRRASDHWRGTAADRGYGKRWQRESAAYRRRNPLCVRCLSAGWTMPASVVDHITPHRGDAQLFWDETNWQSLCKRCHDRKTRTEDARPRAG